MELSRTESSVADFCIFHLLVATVAVDNSLCHLKFLLVTDFQPLDLLRATSIVCHSHCPLNDMLVTGL